MSDGRRMVVLSLAQNGQQQNHQNTETHTYTLAHVKHGGGEIINGCAVRSLICPSVVCLGLSSSSPSSFCCHQFQCLTSSFSVTITVVFERMATRQTKIIIIIITIIIIMIFLFVICEVSSRCVSAGHNQPRFKPVHSLLHSTAYYIVFIVALMSLKLRLRDLPLGLARAQRCRDVSHPLTSHHHRTRTSQH